MSLNSEHGSGIGRETRVLIDLSWIMRANTSSYGERVYSYRALQSEYMRQNMAKEIEE
jgi:hypothetical protein